MQKILHNVDMQTSFMNKTGSLHVKGAEYIVSKINDFFQNLPNNYFEFAIFSYDTHIESEYYKNPESQLFPQIHCEYKTQDWQLAVNDNYLKCKKYYMLKNQFDFWSQNTNSEIKNVFKICNDKLCENPIDDRDAFFNKNKSIKEVYLIGVASDYCNRYALNGYLKRDFKVIILKDLTKGIEKETEEIISETYYKQFTENGKLVIMDSKDFLTLG